MLSRGRARKLTVYLSETDRRHGKPLYQALVELAQRHGIAGATVVRSVMGYGASGLIHTAALVDLSPQLPIKVEMIDSPEAIERFLPDVYDVVDEGLVEVAEVVKWKPRAADKSAEARHVKLEGKAKMMHIHVGAADTWEGEPLHEALTRRLHFLDLAGVTVYRGLLGYGASGRIHRRKTWRSADEPITLVVVDRAEKIEQALPAIDEMVTSGMVVISDVDVVFYRAGGKPREG
jgi:uncharacterized protein